MVGKIFTSAEDIASYYMPNSIVNRGNLVLDRLREVLCSELNLTLGCQHMLSKSEGDPRLGYLEVARTGLLREGKVRGIVKKFYSDEGYEIKERNGIMTAKRTQENYLIFVHEGNAHCSVSVSDDYISRATEKIHLGLQKIQPQK